MHFIFGVGDVSCTPSATYTESASPVPSVPASDYQYTEITHTIHSHPHLFPIITPINVDPFEHLLRDHPNNELMVSVCQGLRSGFWPFANTEKSDSLPQGCVTHPQGMPALNDDSLSFLKSQHDPEISLSQYSQTFGTKLLPGMVAQPVFTIPKKGSTKLRLVIKHIAALK